MADCYDKEISFAWWTGTQQVPKPAMACADAPFLTSFHSHQQLRCVAYRGQLKGQPWASLERPSTTGHVYAGRNSSAQHCALSFTCDRPLSKTTFQRVHVACQVSATEQDVRTPSGADMSAEVVIRMPRTVGHTLRSAQCDYIKMQTMFANA